MHLKSKIINDPVYGFITIPGGLIFDLIEHPYFQRLRRIKQLGLTHLVYPGALHTRFQHSLGTMHLMQEAIGILKSKGHSISTEETEGALVAILLHDIGHGPFSHTLEQSIIRGIHHEELSGIFLQRLNQVFSGGLETGIEIYNHQHHKSFLSQLVASQLDVDRLDYLTRDSFFTGVSEGVIGTQRIIKMLDVAGGDLVVESKGIHSVEKFIIARQIMYWQVYLHKTVLAAENMLIRILERAKFL
ncbi:MAG: HD domain-containing protein, partial [Bacteroidales bacterium]